MEHTFTFSFIATLLSLTANVTFGYIQVLFTFSQQDACLLPCFYWWTKSCIAPTLSAYIVILRARHIQHKLLVSHVSWIPTSIPSLNASIPQFLFLHSPSSLHRPVHSYTLFSSCNFPPILHLFIHLPSLPCPFFPLLSLCPSICLERGDSCKCQEISELGWWD